MNASLFKIDKRFTIPLERVKRPFVEFTDTELIAAAGKTLVFDIESYSNYFLIAFKELETNKIVYFELSPDSGLHISKLLWVMQNFRLIGFNSARYDIIVAWLAINGYSTPIIKQVSDKIIKQGATRSDIEQQYGFKVVDVNHIDLVRVVPMNNGVIPLNSLKAYAGRLHTARLQDLPFNPDAYLTREEAEAVRYYCVNDLDATSELFKVLEPQIKLREELGKLYDLDLRSSSDANIAERVLNHEITKIVGHKIKRPKIEPGTVYKYPVPKYIKYQTPALQKMLSLVRQADLIVTDKGNILMPPELDGYKIDIGRCTYRMGIGGLHSSEKQVAHKADDETDLSDIDVASYYPNIILNLELYPKQTGKVFLEVYKSLVARRLEAKHNGNKVIADSLKITINGSFGKTANKYSCIYSPNIMVTITITGQLSLLLLIEMIELAGIPVVSGNTDGIVVKCPKKRRDDLKNIIAYWERVTGFEMEETRYKAIYCRDVNNYVAVKENDEFKVKGVYAEKGSSGNTVLAKNPANLVCMDAVKQMILKNTPIEETIKACQDIRRFITVRNVKGGAEKDGYYLGKVIRWYYAENVQGEINYVTNGNRVPRTEGAKPLMDLPANFPEDIDYKWYITEANEILKEIAFLDPPKRAKQLTFF